MCASGNLPRLSAFTRSGQPPALKLHQAPTVRGWCTTYLRARTHTCRFTQKMLIYSKQTCRLRCEHSALCAPTPKNTGLNKIYPLLHKAFGSMHVFFSNLQYVNMHGCCSECKAKIYNWFWISLLKKTQTDKQKNTTPLWSCHEFFFLAVELSSNASFYGELLLKP